MYVVDGIGLVYHAAQAATQLNLDSQQQLSFKFNMQLN